MIAKIKLLSNSAILPQKATEYAAAYDVYVPSSTLVKKGRQIIPLDFAIELPVGYEAKIEPRSGFSAKGMESISGKRMDADVIQGKIDCDYRGCVGVIVNNRDEQFWIEAGMRIAQMTVYQVNNVVFKEVDELSETDRGDGGFGHTGS